MKDTKNILKALCIESGVSGNEKELSKILTDLFNGIAEVTEMPNGNIIASMGDKNSDNHIMLDAHIDRIGLTVTYIDENGFIKAESVGGIDLRTLPSSAVTIKGKCKVCTTSPYEDGKTLKTLKSEVPENITGIICTMPPHIDKGSGELEKDKIWIDTGLPAEKVKMFVSLGDSIIVKSSYRELLNNKVTVSALDNRAGCTALIKCAMLLKDKKLPCRVSFVFSSQEETNESGARTAAFMLNPNEAVVVDVGFAKQEGVPSEKSGELGCGAIISIAPVLSRKITDRLTEISLQKGIDCDFEVDGEVTGTNADGIAVTRCGIPCGVISIPEKNMHSQTETVSIDDIESVAEILAEYVIGGGIKNA